jgi:hypothetical protein
MTPTVVLLGTEILSALSVTNSKWKLSGNLVDIQAQF